ncbi:uncharacterized protein LOC124115672 [Haliotis rufescens]|uniref:uncharacterized protein LOC124115672 n=1 Tax=Haliotis rufescens TaxID=6454 RepID=UPI00201F5290|nr:uncharacterized protein LOC124115672 [Haliotis rufescens]XP_046332697.2 uncharacterized protein LOC124115672 [Haliotis rufescens]
MASNEAGSRNICARLLLNEKGTLTITEDPSACVPNTKNQLLSVTGPGGEVKEFYYGKAPDDQPVLRVDPEDKADSCPVTTSNTGPNKSVLTESQAKSLAVMLSTVQSQITARKPWALDHSYTMKDGDASNTKPRVSPAVKKAEQAKVESEILKRVNESIKYSLPSSSKSSVYSSTNGSRYDLMTSKSSYSAGDQSSRPPACGHLPKPNLSPASIATTDGGAPSSKKQSKYEGASGILKQLSASVPVLVMPGNTRSLATGPECQSSPALNRIPQIPVAPGKQYRQRQTRAQMRNVTLKSSGVMGYLKDMLASKINVKGQEVTPHCGKGALNTTQTVPVSRQAPVQNVSMPRRQSPGVAHSGTAPKENQKSIQNQTAIDPVLQRMLKNVQKASASIKETLPVPVSDAFNSNSPPCKPQSKKVPNVQEKGNHPREVTVRVYPDKPGEGVKPDPRNLVQVNPHSGLPVLNAPQIAFVPDVVPRYCMPVVITQTSSSNSFPLVYNQCTPSGSVGKTIIVTTNTQVPIGLGTNLPPTSTNASECSPVSSKAISFSVPSTQGQKTAAVIDQQTHVHQHQIADLVLPRIESVFSLAHTEGTETQKNNLNKDMLKVKSNSGVSCYSKGPGKTKVRKVDDVEREKGNGPHTIDVPTAPFIGVTQPINNNDTPGGINSSTVPDSNEDGLSPRSRYRKAPKRLVAEDLPTFPKSIQKQKPNLRPIIFDPCFVVLERIAISSNRKITKLKQKRKSKEYISCSKRCRELFLRRLCEKQQLPGNQCTRKVNDRDRQAGEHEPSVLRWIKRIQSKRKINTEPASPNEVKRYASAAYHVPGKLITVGTIGNTDAKGSKYVVVEVPNLVPAPGAFETVATGKPTDISPLPLNRETYKTLNESTLPQSEMGSVCLNSDRSPRSLSSETESTVSENCVFSDFSDTSPVKSPKVVASTDATSTRINSSLKAFDSSQITSLPSNATEESQVEQSQPTLNSESSHLEAQSPINPSEDSSEYVEPLCNLQNEEQLETEMTGGVKKEDSDEDWMNVELEVDPDSESDEDLDLFLPDDPPADPVPRPEPEHELEVPSASITSTFVPDVVLSDKVQRLKAMLAEQMRQVENIRRQRTNTK